MVSKRGRGGFSNVAHWYRTGDITLGFISVSKSCIQALSVLPEDEREEFPSDLNLLKVRMKLLADVDLRRIIMDTMGEDIALSGVPMEQTR